MKIRNILKGFEAFKSEFELFERDSKHSNANSNHSKEQIRTIGTTFETNFLPFERNSTHWNANSKFSKGIRSIRMEIQTFRTRFEALECIF